MEGEDLILGDFSTKEDALGDCAAIVRECAGSLTIHRADGTVEEERTYARSVEEPQTAPL